MKKKICVVTSNRADYGLLYHLLQKIKASSKLELQLLVTGSHLSEKFGYTVNQIKADKLPITEEVPILDFNSPAQTLSNAITRLSASFGRLRPDLILLLGDRFEILGAAQAALLLGIPVGHIHGGELTEGAFDDAIRHALTKLSHLHFTSNEIHRRRVIQLGELPKRVFTVGAPGLDFIQTMKFLNKDELASDLKFEWQKKNFLVTYHPETLKTQDEGKVFETIIQTLLKSKDANIFVTFPNFDPGFEAIIEKLNHLAKNSNRLFVFQSLGQLRYLSLMKFCTAVIGNSSSGIIEAPFLKVRTLNIGKRQKGRVSDKSVIQSQATKSSIQRNLSRLIKMPPLKKSSNLYGNGKASEKIVKILEKTNLKGITIKSFFDLK